MSSNIYDNDCSIIKQPVSTDEFKTVIDSLRGEIANLKKEIELLKSKNNNDFIIDTVDFYKEDTVVEKEHQQILKYIKSIISSKDFRDTNEIEINKLNETMYSIIYNIVREYIITKIKPSLFDYLRRRNLYIIVKGEHNHGFGFGPDYDHKVSLFLLHKNHYEYNNIDPHCRLYG